MSRVIVILSIFYTALFATLSDDSFAMTSDVEFHKLDGVTDTFQHVSFLNSYSSRPVVVCTHSLSSNSEVEAAVRLDNLDSSGFDIRVQRPIDRAHDATKVQCMVAKEGVNELENGYKFEAYSVLSTDTSGAKVGWAGTGENVTSQLTLDHGDTPAVLGQVMTYNDVNFSTFWTYDCSSAGAPPKSSSICVGKQIGETTDHLPGRYENETLGYIVIEESNGSITTTVAGFPPTVITTIYKAALGPDSIDGLSNLGASYDVEDDYKLGVATISAMDGGDGGWAVCDPFEGNYIDLAIDEDTLNGTDRSHTYEQVAYWIFDQDPGLDWMEVVKVSDVGGDWKTVSFRNSYSDTPVAVCTYNIPSTAHHEAVVRMTDVTKTEMKIKMQRPKTGTDVTASDVYCIIMEEGDHTFDGHNVEAHFADSDGLNGRYYGWSNAEMEHVNYSQDYTNPVVLGQVMSYNNEEWTAFWCNNGDQTTPPDKDNLYVGKHVGKEAIKYRMDETLGYIIGKRHEGEINHYHYLLAQGDNRIDGVKSYGDKYDLSDYGTDQHYEYYSYGVASLVAMNGYQGGWAVLYGDDPINEYIHLAIDEETAAGDTSRGHTSEQVSFWVVEPMPVMAISKVSCVIDDPVNDTTDPKRIPGATIRYAIEVNNTGPGSAKDAKADDDLSAYFDTTSITTPKVLSGGCGDCKSLSGGTESGEINGSTVTVDFGTVDAGRSATPTQECGYFDVEIK